MRREPKSGRIFLTAEDIAERCHCSSRTVLRWRDDPRFIDVEVRKWEDPYGYSRQKVLLFDWEQVKDFLRDVGAWDEAVELPDVATGRRVTPPPLGLEPAGLEPPELSR